MFVMFYTLNS